MELTSHSHPENLNPENLKKERPLLVPEGIYGRLFYAFCVIIAPLLGFAISFDGSSLGPDWQYEKIRAYPEILLSGDIIVYFSPFILFSIVSFVFLLISPQKFAARWFVRMGIYTGFVLVIHYTILLLFTRMYFLILMIGVPTGVIIFGLKWIFPLAVQRWGKRDVIQWTAIGVGILILGFGLITFILDTLYLLLAPFGWALFGIWVMGLALTLPIAARVSYRLWKQYESPLYLPYLARFSVGAWLVAYFGQWLNAWFEMERIYYSLPTDPPDCYIATAAAKGHPHIVKSTQMGSMRVNRQLQTLKVAELLMKAVAPTWHVALRRRYDIYGRKLAQKITHPLLADLAYLTLKPAEWLSGWVIQLVIPNADQLIDGAYKNTKR
ncbi:MAG: DUF6688 family protein [Chloroflexota bacterium]